MRQIKEATANLKKLAYFFRPENLKKDAGTLPN